MDPKVHQAQDILTLARVLQNTARDTLIPPQEISRPHDEPLLSGSLFRPTLYYIQSTVSQINVTYSNACYDACAVMIRRLLETLIIECFENYHIADQIQDASENYLPLEELVIRVGECKSWQLGRNTKKGLKSLKETGDLAAHSRRYVAHRKDIDGLATALRVSAQELALIAGLK